MGLFGSKHNADLHKGQCHIHNVVSNVLEVAITRTKEFADADQPQLSLTNNKNQATVVNYSDLLNYIHHVWIIIEEHHWHEENLIFPVVKQKAPAALQAIEGFEKDHVHLVDLLHQLDTRVHEKDIKSVGPHAAEVASLLTQIKELLLPHFKAEETVLSREQLQVSLSQEEQNAIEGKILKHVQASPQSSVRFAIMYYSQSDADRNSMFGAVPRFVLKLLLPYAWYWSYKHLTVFFTNY
jgi:iron-sulfur cluster repair protein YtfE (RIC family)